MHLLQAEDSEKEAENCIPGVYADAPGGCTGIHPGGAWECTGGVYGDAPKPSLNPSLQPPEEPPLQPPAAKSETPVVVVVEPGEAEIFHAYAREIGRLTPSIRAAVSAWLEAGEVPRAWIPEAIRLAALSNARRWSYVDGILNNWKQTGKTTRRRNRHGTRPKQELSPEQESADLCAAQVINEMSRLRRLRLEAGAAG